MEAFFGNHVSIRFERTNINIALVDIRGHVYNNGANMKGRSAILELDPRAFYVPCVDHSVDINDAAKHLVQTIPFIFCIDQTLASFKR